MICRSMTHRAESPRRSAGFTLVELLVVIGIIMTLAAILLPALNTAYRNATRARMAGDLQAIVTALEAYKADFGDYPRTYAWNSLPPPTNPAIPNVPAPGDLGA